MLWWNWWQTLGFDAILLAFVGWGSKFLRYPPNFWCSNQQLKQKKTTPRPNGWPPGVIMFIRHSKPSLLRPIQGIGVRVSSHGKWLPSTLKYASSGRRIAESEWRKDLGGWRICSGRKCGEQKGTTYTLHMEIHDGLINWFYVVQDLMANHQHGRNIH